MARERRGLRGTMIGVAEGQDGGRSAYDVPDVLIETGVPKGIVGEQRLFAHLIAPSTCPIALDTAYSGSSDHST